MSMKSFEEIVEERLAAGDSRIDAELFAIDELEAAGMLEAEAAEEDWASEQAEAPTVTEATEEKEFEFDYDFDVPAEEQPEQQPTTELEVLPQLRDFLPPLSAEEYKALESDIIANGCMSPIVTWRQKYIVDGHHRFEICWEHGIDFQTQNREFENIDDAKLWMLEHQLGCRNLNKFQRVEIVLRAKDTIAAAARERQLAGVKQDLPQNSAEGLKGETRDVLAKMASASHEYIRCVEKILTVASRDELDALRNGESVNSVYTKYFPPETQATVQATQPSPQAAQPDLPQPETDTVDELTPQTEAVVAKEDTPSAKGYKGEFGDKAASGEYDGRALKRAMSKMQSWLDDDIGKMAAIVEAAAAKVTTVPEETQFVPLCNKLRTKFEQAAQACDKARAAVQAASPIEAVAEPMTCPTNAAQCKAAFFHCGGSLRFQFIGGVQNHLSNNIRHATPPHKIFNGFILLIVSINLDYVFPLPFRSWFRFRTTFRFQGCFLLFENFIDKFPVLLL